jgi:hypothetical protein
MQSYDSVHAWTLHADHVLLCRDGLSGRFSIGLDRIRRRRRALLLPLGRTEIEIAAITLLAQIRVTKDSADKSRDLLVGIDQQLAGRFDFVLGIEPANTESHAASGL